MELNRYQLPGDFKRNTGRVYTAVTLHALHAIQEASPCCVRTVSRTSCWFPSYSKRTSTEKFIKQIQMEVCHPFPNRKPFAEFHEDAQTSIYSIIETLEDAQIYLNSSSLLISQASPFQGKHFPGKPGKFSPGFARESEPSSSCPAEMDLE